MKFGQKLVKIKNSANVLQILRFFQQSAKNSAFFNEKFEIRERCKGVHCVDLGESFPTSIYLQKSASIQPRTSPSKFAGKYSILFTGVLSEQQLLLLLPAMAPAAERGRPGAEEANEFFVFENEQVCN